MADLLGVVASGIAVTQLAGQVAKSVIKLKECWDQVQDAPDEIRYLLREIESLNLILTHIQDDQAKRTEDTILVNNQCIRQSLALCREGAGELSGLVDELAEKVEGKKGWKKKVGSVKVVLKKEDIKKLKKRMKHAIQLLQLSYQFHTNAMVQLQPDIIVTRMANHITSLKVTSNIQERPGTSIEQIEEVPRVGSVVDRQYDIWISSPSWIAYLFGQFDFHQRARLHRGQQINDVTARYKLPEFVANKVLDFQCHRVLSGWRANIRTYRVIPGRNPFFDAILNGNLVAVRQMLVNKEYFVSDRTDNDVTPLHFAALGGEIEVCRELLSAGADVSIRDYFSYTPFHRALQNGGVNSFGSRGHAFDICRLLLGEGAIDILIDDIRVIQVFSGPLEMLRFIHQQSQILCTGQSSLSVHDRIKVAAKLANSGWHNTPLLVDYWLNSEVGLIGDLAHWVDETGMSLLHIIARGFSGASTYSITDIAFDPSMDPRLLNQILATRNMGCAWRPLIRKLISAGCSAYAIDQDGHSILFIMVYAFVRDSYWKSTPIQNLKTLVQGWLEDLVACGVDLLRYGVAETVHWRRGNWGYDCSCPVNSLVQDASCQKQHVSYWNFGKFYIGHDWKRIPSIEISFVYGPRPEDWIFGVHTPYQGYAADFWNMVESDEGHEPCIYVPSKYVLATWPDLESFEFESSEDGWSEDEEEMSSKEQAERPMPGSWSKDFED